MIDLIRHLCGRRTAVPTHAHAGFVIVLLCALSAVVCSVVSVAPAHAVDAEPDREGLVKAAFLYHFVEFVDWPDSVENAADDVIRVGILGKDPFGDVVDEVFGSPASRGQRFEILRTEDPRAVRSCRLVFVALDDDEAIRRALRTLGSVPVLTVAHREGFASAGGHMNFFVEDERLRFEVNLDAVQSAGLRMSSRLLKLARIVTSTPGR